MAPSVRKTSILALAGILATTCLFAQSPPQDLRLEQDHWTAWDPPDEVPEGSQVYIVQPGDTLWDLAERNFGDPYLWPQLWERNQYILDAHWIYPGDPLIMSVEVVPIGELADADESMGMEDSTGSAGGAMDDSMGEDEDMRFARDSQAPVALGTETDMYCSGFIGPADMSFPHEIVGSEAAALAPSIYGAKHRKTIEGKFGVVNTLKSGLSISDIVYVDGGRSAGMSAGSTYAMVAPREVVRHPLTGARMGRFYRHMGRARILSVQQDTAMAEIMHSCNPVEIGALLMPFVPEPVPLARQTVMRPVNMPASDSVLENAGSIVHVDHSLLSMSEGSVVFIDRGAAQDVTPGDMFTIYRVNNPGLPAVVLGELAVLSVQDDTAMAKILSSRYTIRLGDRVDPK